MNGQWLGLGLASMMAAAAQAGTVVHMDWRSLPDGKAQPRTVIYAQDGQFRMDTLDDSGHVREFVLVRDGNIWQVDVQKRTFLLFDKAALAGQQTSMQTRMQAMLQRVSPERRAAMEARMKSILQHAQGAAVSFSDTGQADRAGSWSCEVWQLRRDGKAVSDACIAAAGTLAGGSELVDATHKAAAAAADVLASVPAARSATARFQMFGQANGFPVRTRDLNGDQPEGEEVVSTIETQSLPADKFAIPKGFTRTTLGGVGDD